MKRGLLGLAALVLASVSLSAQTTLEEMAKYPERCGGRYYAYPVTESANTPAPKGYEAFYISHYSRHGSRYMISDKDYTGVLDVFEKAHKAGALTALGEDVRRRMQVVCEEAEGRGGELTPLGARQQHDIGQRMYDSYSRAFSEGADVTAVSTVTMRVAHSMFNFVLGLKERDPRLNIPMESAQRNMKYLCHSEPVSWEFNDDKAEPWKAQRDKFKASMTKPDRLIGSLFHDDDFVTRAVRPDQLMWGLYEVASDLQNMEADVTLYDIFEPEELVDLWQAGNYSYYATNSSYPLSRGVNVDNAKNLLRNIVETADSYISEGKHGATLRFGHDGNITPLVALMQLEGGTGYENDPAEVYKVWNDWNVTPMASNVQIVFFRNKKGDVLCKFMRNEREVSIPCETDMFPFYRWDAARATLQRFIDTPSRDFFPEKYRF
ncbi:MAG: histidine phosphatase family protein [Muribaculaceae bacterium]|nr:histidine phosphatase family protein [Muribaculaceae bacterium]MDE6609678.1 histidine phosphatase family protein [Muribaculaceae bacterium]